MPIEADIYYHAYQEGDAERPPVVLIHGAGGTHMYWPSEIRRLPGYRVYALDLPGHGKSGGRGRQSILAYTNSVLAWMEAVGLHRAVFIGHSMGSAIVQILALDYAEHVLGIGLLGSAAKLQVNPSLLEATAHPTTFYKAVETVIKWSYGPETPPQLTELAAKRMAEVRPAVLHGDLLACDTYDETRRVAEIQQPALIVCGALDKMTPLRNAQFLADTLPNAMLEIIPNAGHMVMLERPQPVANALIKFLSTVPY